MITLSEINIDSVRILFRDVFDYGDETEEAIIDLFQYLSAFPRNLEYLTEVVDRYCDDQGLISVCDDYFIRDGTLNYCFAFDWPAQEYRYAYTATDDMLYPVMIVAGFSEGASFHLAAREDNSEDYDQVRDALLEHLENGTDRSISDYINS